MFTIFSTMNEGVKGQLMNTKRCLPGYGAVQMLYLKKHKSHVSISTDSDLESVGPKKVWGDNSLDNSTRHQVGLGH